MNRNLNIFLWVIFFTLMAPSGMALASWNAVPGDSTYGMKLAMEKVLLLAISPSSELQSTTNFKLTERRMGEVTKVLSGVHAKESLDNLSMQIEATRKSLSGITDEQAKKEAIARYIETLHQVTSQLEEQKVNRAISYLPPQRKTTTSYKIVNPRQTTTTTAPTTTQTQTTKPVVNNVTNNYYYQAPPATGGNTNPTIRPTSNTPTISTPTTGTPTAQPIAQPTIQPTSQPDQLPEEEIIQPDVVENINDTQEEIDQVIEELEQEAQNIPDTEGGENQPQESEPPQQEEQSAPQGENSNENNGQGNGNGNGQQNENNGQEQNNGNSEANGGE